MVSFSASTSAVADGLSGPPSRLLDGHRRLLEEMGGEYHEIVGTDVAGALVRLRPGRERHPAGSGIQSPVQVGGAHPGIGDQPRRPRLSGSIDVHVISHERGDEHTQAPVRRRRAFSPLPPRRRALGWLLAVGGLPLLTLALANLRGSVGLPTALVLFLALVVSTAAVGGRWPAFLVAVGGFLCANWFFTPPFRRWTIAEADHTVALVVFLGVAALVSHFVDAAAHRSIDSGKGEDRGPNARHPRRHNQ